MRMNYERARLCPQVTDASYGAMTPCARSPPLVICVESIASWVRKKRAAIGADDHHGTVQKKRHHRHKHSSSDQLTHATSHHQMRLKVLHGSAVAVSVRAVHILNTSNARIFQAAKSLARMRVTGMGRGDLLRPRSATAKTPCSS